MNGRTNVLVGLSALTVLAASSASFAQDSAKPPMHMNKSDMVHNKADSEVATEYKSEATMLTEKAASHRQLAANYRSRGGGGKTDYAQIAKHCDNLAKFYEDAAKEAQAISSALTKAK